MHASNLGSSTRPQLCATLPVASHLPTCNSPPAAPSSRSNWRTSVCGGHSVSVLLKELDRRGLVVAREDTSGGKRICYFRNLAC